MADHDLLVSCNPGLFLVNTENGTVEHLRGGSYSGIALTGSRIFVGEPDGLLELDRSLSEVRRVDLKGPRPVGVHGIFAMDERLYLCATGWNTITVLDVHSLKPVGKIRPPGRHPSSVWVDDQVLFVSVHIRAGSASERPGAILALDRGTSRILEKRSIPNLAQPHSVVRWGQDLFYCVSGDQALHRNGEPMGRFRGYPRGLAVDAFNYYVGQSRFRHGPHIPSVSGIVVVGRQGGERRYIPVPSEEVFDVALLEVNPVEAKHSETRGTRSGGTGWIGWQT